MAASCHYVPNNFFNFQGGCYDKDRQVYKELHAESVNIFGNNTWYYYVTYDTSYDPVFQEDPSRRIYRKFPLKVYYELPTTNRVYSKFGIDIIDQVVGIISKDHWNVVSQYNTSGATLYPPSSGDSVSAFPSEVRPRMGDILYFEDSKTYYEITDVDGAQDSGQIFLKQSHTWYVFLRVMRDEKLGLSPSTSAALISDGPVIPITSADTIQDYLDVTSAVESEITERDFMYKPSLTEEPPLESDSLFFDDWNQE